MQWPVTRKFVIPLAVLVVATVLIWITLSDIQHWKASWIRSPNAIHVVEATYGENCLNFAPASGHSDPVRIGNATVIASQSCNNTDVFCPVYIDHVKIGDPARGCAKDFSIAWRCGASATVHRNHRVAEAVGYVLWIGCPAEEP